MNTVVKTLTKSVLLASVFSIPAYTAAVAQAAAIAPNAPLPEAYSAIGSGISYFNTPNRKHTTITGQEPTVLGKVTVDLKRTSDVLVQFNSSLATISDAGCPCSVRASLQADQEAPIVIKRVNLAVRPPQAEKYVPDRQSADGSYVFRLQAGQHSISLVVQQVDGSASSLQAFYGNIQALVFEKN